MNDEYIKQSAAVCIANYAADEHPYKRDDPKTRTEYNEGWCDACDYIESRLETLPAAPVREVVRGKWEQQELAPTRWRFCSRCGFANSRNSKWKFCPNCGADMRQTEGGETT